MQFGRCVMAGWVAPLVRVADVSTDVSQLQPPVHPLTWSYVFMLDVNTWLVGVNTNHGGMGSPFGWHCRHQDHGTISLSCVSDLCVCVWLCVAIPSGQCVWMNFELRTLNFAFSRMRINFLIPVKSFSNLWWSLLAIERDILTTMFFHLLQMFTL